MYTLRNRKDKATDIQFHIIMMMMLTCHDLLNIIIIIFILLFETELSEVRNLWSENLMRVSANSVAYSRGSVKQFTT